MWAERDRLHQDKVHNKIADTCQNCYKLKFTWREAKNRHASGEEMDVINVKENIHII